MKIALDCACLIDVPGVNLLVMSTASNAKPLPVNLKYANKGNLTEGPLVKHLVRLTLPMVWGIFAIISFQLVDTWYISRLGVTELAAVSFTFPVTMTVFSLTLGLSIGMSSVVSRVIGSGNQDEAKRITTHGIMLAIIFAITIAVLGFSFMVPVFRAMGADDALLPLIKDYMWIWFAGSIFIATPIVGNSAMRASGDSFSPAIIMTVVAVINLVLDPILIFGLFGFPRLEIQGAALSTIFANSCAMAAGLYILARKKRMISLAYCNFKNFGNSVKRLLFIGIPAGLTSVLQPVTNAVLIAILANSGEAAIAAFGVVNRIEAFALIVLMALATGMAPIIGQNWGAERFDRVHKTLWIALGFSVGWSIAAATFLSLLAKPVAGLFIEDNPDALTYIILYLWIVPFSWALGNLVHGWSSAFNAMGKPQRSFIMLFTKLVILTIPGAFIGYDIAGVKGVFIAIAATNILTGAVFHIWNWQSCKAAQAEVKQPQASSANP